MNENVAGNRRPKRPAQLEAGLSARLTRGAESWPLQMNALWSGARFGRRVEMRATRNEQLAASHYRRFLSTIATMMITKASRRRL
jgi:hypothetical protein